MRCTFCHDSNMLIMPSAKNSTSLFHHDLGFPRLIGMGPRNYIILGHSNFYGATDSLEAIPIKLSASTPRAIMFI